MDKYIFFDLDSTLLQMNQDLFLKHYFASIYKYSAKLGYNPDEFMKKFNVAAFSIIKNDGSMTNEDLFFNAMKPEYSDSELLKKQFNDFYIEEFDKLKDLVMNNISNTSNELINVLKAKGYKIVLATNPLFPIICTEKRIKWAGMNPNDFEYITTYENCYYCKPNRKYYYEIANKLNISLDNITMVGNDLSDDFSDLPEEMNKILITDYLINTKNLEITMPTYTLAEFLKYAKENM